MGFDPSVLISKVRSAGVEVSGSKISHEPQTQPVYGSDNPTHLAFASGSLLFKGRQIHEVILELTMMNPVLLSEVADELEAFKRFQLKRLRDEKSKGPLSGTFENGIAKLIALCEGYQSHIAETLRGQLVRTQTGYDVHLDEDSQLLLNGINLHQLLQTARENPNPRSRIYLQGLRRRLHYLLSQSHSSSHLTRLRDILEDLFHDVESILAA